MVLLPHASLTPRAAGASSGDGSVGNGFFRKRRPLITYGRNDTKPLSLTASHFRRDPYTVPADEDDDETGRGQTDGPSTQVGARAFLDAAEDDDAESELSDKPDGAPPDESDGSQQLIQCPRAGDAAAAPIIPLSTGNPQNGTAYSFKTSKTKRKPVYTPKSSIPAPKRAKHSRKETPTAPTAAKAPRRLLVKKLLLVATPVDYTNFGSPQSSVHEIQTQDPINDRTSSARGRNASHLDSEDETESRQSRDKQPLSAFKKRLRSDKYRYKSVVAMRKKRAEHSPTDLGHTAIRGDGFDSRELYISPLARETVFKRRLRQDPLISGFKALQLQSGPFPDVAFEPASSQLKVEAKPSPPNNDKSMHAPPQLVRHASFSDRAREEAIMAQLSGISALAVPRPESNDGEEEDEDDLVEDEEVCTEMDEDQIANGFEAIVDDDDYEADTEVEGPPQAQPQNNDAESPPTVSRVALPPRDSPCTPDRGVSLDFRRRMPGQLPRRRIRQDTLKEVHENIVEVCDSDSLSARQPQPVVDAYQVHPQAAVTTPEMLQAPRSQLRRPRSILKNVTHAVPDSTTHAEHTAANTRRNSTVELSVSRYFTDAADMLRNADPTKHKIVPRRRSSYFDDVEMLDSQAVVLETPTPDTDAEMLDYPEGGDLTVLGRSSFEAEWTSQSLPTIPRDLKTLTRSVSRGYGTLSQSARRRPSLPFQSPTKVG